MAPHSQVVSDVLGQLILLPPGRARRVVESILPLADTCPSHASALISLCRKCSGQAGSKVGASAFAVPEFLPDCLILTAGCLSRPHCSVKVHLTGVIHTDRFGAPFSHSFLFALFPPQRDDSSCCTRSRVSWLGMLAAMFRGEGRVASIKEEFKKTSLACFGGRWRADYRR